MGNAGKILVIRGGSISDFMLTLPVFTKLREYFPDTGIEAMAYPHIGQIALAGGLVERVHPINTPSLAQFFAKNARLDEDLADCLSEFDVIFSYLFDPDQIFETNVGRCSPAQFIPGSHRPDEFSVLHASEVFLKPLERLGIFDRDFFAPLEFKSPNTGLPARKKRIVLHPGEENGAWPDEFWSRLILRLVEETDFPALLIGTEMERERLNSLRKLIPEDRLDFAVGLPLTEAGQMMSECSNYFGRDSGMAHLASVLGLQGVVLWNERNLEIWKPHSPRIRIVQHEGGSPERNADRVWNAFESQVRSPTENQ